MKKWIVLILCLVIAGGVFVDIAIPSTLTITRTVSAQCRAAAAFPFLSDEGRWEAWWPDSVERAGFHIRGLSYQTVEIGIGEGPSALGSRLVVLSPGNQELAVLHWETQLQCGWNPLQRMRQYRRARRLGDVMGAVLAQASAYFGKKENLYGIPIREASTTDTLLVLTRVERSGMPGNEDIYAQIARLDRYIRENHSQRAGYPMVNITPLEDKPGTYRLMVAIPVASRLEGKGDIQFTRLIPGKYLVTEVRGGTGTVSKALSGLKDYIRDYQRTVMAIPFESLVTDRVQEPDSARWVTRIYYPVF